MSYRIILAIALCSALQPAFATVKQKPLTLNHKLHKTVNTVDPYEYCFNNSIWIVPPQTLRATIYDTGVTSSVVDQTVWVTGNYDSGYFSGNSYTAINVTSLSQRYLIGSVAADGRVYITFYYATSSTYDLVTGVGTLTTNSSGQCSFTMQMNSGTNGVSGLAHWSYMIPVKPGDPYYQNLPGSGGLSVPQFLAQF